MGERSELLYFKINGFSFRVNGYNVSFIRRIPVNFAHISDAFNGAKTGTK